MELSKDSFVDDNLREHYSDLLYRVQQWDGAASLVYVLLEHKRTPERLTGFQLLRYLVRIWERAEAQGLAKTGLPPIIPIVVYQEERPWPHGQTLQAALTVPKALAPYTPDFRYVLCDLTGLRETEIRGAVLMRAALLLMKHITDPRLAERLPEVFGLLRALADQRTVLGHLETLLRYVAAAADTVSEDELRRALGAALPETEETLMATLAQQWLEQGREQGRAEGLQAGEKRVLLRLLKRRFGAVPATYQDRIAAGDAETVLLWSERVLSAQGIEEIFVD